MSNVGDSKNNKKVVSPVTTTTTTTTTNAKKNIKKRDDPSKAPIDMSAGWLLVIYAVIVLQAIIFQTYIMTLVIIVSTLLFVVFGCPQPELPWESEYYPMAKKFIDEIILKNDNDNKNKNGNNDRMIIAITGSTSGIGMELVRILAKNSIDSQNNNNNNNDKDAGDHGLRVKVIAIGRSKTKLQSLQAEYPNAIDTILCDLTDLQSVANAANEMNEKYPRLDMLVNNAGIQLGMQNLWKGLSMSQQGHDLVFGVNYLSHFLLTEKLIPLLDKSRKPKIIQVSSSYHWAVNGDDLRPPGITTTTTTTTTTTKNHKKLPMSPATSAFPPPVACQVGGSHGFGIYRGIRQYANSKLAQILHARALQRRYKHITSVSACPLWVGSQIVGPEGSFIHKGFTQLAFPVNGYGINSFLYAMFDDQNVAADAITTTTTAGPSNQERTDNADNNNNDDDDNNDYYYDDFYINASPTRPNPVDLFPSWTYHVVPIRDIVGNILSFSMLPFQRFMATYKRTGPSSRVSYDKELQESLYEWSKMAVAEYM